MDELSEYFESNDEVVISKSDYEKFNKELNTFFAHRTTVTEEDEIAAIKYFFMLDLSIFLGFMINLLKI